MKLSELDAKSDSMFYKPKDGDNKVRIVSDWAMRDVVFPGNDYPTRRFHCWVIDREDGRVKLAEFGKSVVRQLQTLQSSEEYSFDDLPPYDITIKKEGENLKTKYSVTPARQDTPLTEEEQKEIEGLEKISEFLARVNGKKSEAQQSVEAQGLEQTVKPEITADSIPF